MCEVKVFLTDVTDFYNNLPDFGDVSWEWTNEYTDESEEEESYPNACQSYVSTNNDLVGHIYSRDGDSKITRLRLGRDLERGYNFYISYDFKTKIGDFSMSACFFDMSDCCTKIAITERINLEDSIESNLHNITLKVNYIRQRLTKWVGK